MICPKCKQPLIRQDQRYLCSNNHSYDIARQGYVNLLLKNSPNHGDNKAMVMARSHFLEQDHYLPLVKEIISVIRKHCPEMTSLLDLGCGQGYYTSHFQKAFPEAYVAGIDISKEAISYAAKQNRNIQYIVASNADLPLEDSSFDAATCLFSFADDKETARVLKEGGLLITADPHARHLYALKQKVYETPYLNETAVLTRDGFQLIGQSELTYVFHLSTNEAIRELFAMTPYAYKTKKEDIAKLDDLDQLDVEASFSILVYRKTK